MKKEKDYEGVVAALNERLERHDNNRRAVQESLHSACNKLRKRIDEIEEDINKRLEEKFTKEDNRLQNVLAELRKRKSGDEEGENSGVSKAVDNAIAELIVVQTYELMEWDFEDKEGKTGKTGVSKMFELTAKRQVAPEWIHMEKPMIITATKSIDGDVFLEVAGGIANEESIKENNYINNFKYKAFIYKDDNEAEGNEFTLFREDPLKNKFSFKPEVLESETAYKVKVKILCNDKESEWSDPFEFITPGLSSCTWARCPEHIIDERKYSLDRTNFKIASKTGNNDHHCTIIGNTPLPLRKENSWSISILRSDKNDGKDIYIGVAPFNIDQNEDNNFRKCGWYLSCFDSVLTSGPPHNYNWKEYGARKGKAGGVYVHTRDIIGVVMNTGKGELSFVIGGINIGIAFEGIPLDKPLVPCVIVGCKGDFIELDTSGTQENVNTSISAPTNITTKSTSWDTITLSWSGVWRASSYQVEVDGSVQKTTATNTFTRNKLLPGVEHIFRVRSVRGNSMSEWSDIVGGKTLDAPNFFGSSWKGCPEDVYWEKKYSLGLFNTRVATKINEDMCCNIIGNAPVPREGVTSWDIKVLKSRKNNGYDIVVGIAPFDINQNGEDNYKRCGWYLNCYDSSLWSGPPHNYKRKEYGPRKENGDYVHKGSIIGVVMDTTKGELSFVLNGVNLGIAFEGIPLDKPLVPCVLLRWGGDSVELIFKKPEEVRDK